MEVDSQLDISVDLEYITQDQFANIRETINTVGKQLSALRSKYVTKES